MGCLLPAGPAGGSRALRWGLLGHDRLRVCSVGTKCCEHRADGAASSTPGHGAGEGAIPAAPGQGARPGLGARGGCSSQLRWVWCSARRRACTQVVAGGCRARGNPYSRREPVPEPLGRDAVGRAASCASCFVLWPGSTQWSCPGVYGGTGLSSAMEKPTAWLGHRLGAGSQPGALHGSAQGAALGGPRGTTPGWGPVPGGRQRPSCSCLASCRAAEVSFILKGKRIHIFPTNTNPNTNKFLSKCSRWRKLKAVSQADIRGAAFALTSSKGLCFIHQA